MSAALISFSDVAVMPLFRSRIAGFRRSVYTDLGFFEVESLGIVNGVLGVMLGNIAGGARGHGEEYES